MKKFILLLLLVITASCKDTNKPELEKRENDLLLREQEFADKEKEYEQLLKMRDSLLSNAKADDTVAVATTWPDSLKINWNSKMVCKESNCSNYVIGDQRNETWQFVSDSTGACANVINNNKLIRVFKANYKKDAITLTFIADSTVKSKAKIYVVLDDIKKDIIKGTQVITGQNNCEAKFSVELTPATKK